jgi:hypothetical protein
MNTNVVFRWRKEFREGRLGGLGGLDIKNLVPAFAPVQIVPEMPGLPKPPPETSELPPADRAGPGIIHLTVPGGFSLRIESPVDDATLRRVLRAVKDVA